jgi:signal transduction histidine kinase
VASPTGHRGRLFRRYVVIFAALISGGLLASGVVEAYFVYEESQMAVIRLQRERAEAAASTIEQFLRESEHLLDLVSPLQPAGTATLEQRESDYARLLRTAPAISEVSYLDTQGRERILVSRLTANRAGSQVDRSGEAWFAAASSGNVVIAQFSIRDGSSPFVILARAEAGPGSGVVAAQLGLQAVWDVVAQASQGDVGQVYLVDTTGRLIAHPDVSLVLQGTDLSQSGQVRVVRAGPLVTRQQFGHTEAVEPLAPSVLVVSQFDRYDERVYGSSRDRLVAYSIIKSTGWIVFADQPLEQAFAPVRATIVRTVLLLLMGLLLAVLASLYFVRRMVTPIQALQAGAARIGAGALDQRIEVRTGDELESLAEQFNAMAAQLQESYADLEQKVEDRTHEVEQKSRELEVASQHKSELLANMSHELRTPLNAILGFSEVLLERMFGDLNERQEEYLRDILTSGQHLLALINDILDLSKVEAGRMDLGLEDFSLRDALKHGQMMLRERASNHGITLSLEIEPDLDVIHADERKVKQVVFNLLSNAVKFTPDGGRIDVSARRDRDDAVVAVHDNGIGISPEDQQRLFEEFRQVGQVSRQVEGTGLGLALSRKLIELHAGRIEVASEVGVGSTFTVKLPIRCTPVEARDEALV